MYAVDRFSSMQDVLFRLGRRGLWQRWKLVLGRRGRSVVDAETDRLRRRGVDLEGRCQGLIRLRRTVGHDAYRGGCIWV